MLKTSIGLPTYATALGFRGATIKDNWKGERYQRTRYQLTRPDGSEAWESSARLVVIAAHKEAQAAIAGMHRAAEDFALGLAS